MSIRPLLFLLIFLMGNGMVVALTTEENSDEELTVETEGSDDNQVIDVETDAEALPEEINNTVTTKQKGRSIKMIVGGQSTDGLAKQVTLPVED